MLRPHNVVQSSAGFSSSDKDQNRVGICFMSLGLASKKAYKDKASFFKHQNCTKESRHCTERWVRRTPVLPDQSNGPKPKTSGKRTGQSCLVKQNLFSL